MWGPRRARFCFCACWGAGSRAERLLSRVKRTESYNHSTLPKAGAQLPLLERSALKRGVFMRWLCRIIASSKGRRDQSLLRRPSYLLLAHFPPATLACLIAQSNELSPRPGVCDSRIVGLG